MKEKELADRYNVDTCGLREFLENRQLPHYVSFRSGLVVDDDKIDGYVSDYIKYVQSESDSFEEMYEEELKEQREEQELVDDTELVAVIAAAIAAYEGTSTDGFVVRSIRRR